jgi:regulator of sigma E protease
MFTLLVFLLILSLLILVHELGHFLVARKNGVRVEEFGLGLPPRVFGKKIGETIYSLNLLPFGGFVKLSGEDESEIDSEQPADPRSFISKTPLQRALILVAGVFMNFMLAVVLYYTFFFMTGFKTLTLPLLFDYQFKYGQVNATHTVVAGFSEDSPLEMAGAEPGEAVLRIDGMAVNSLEELRNVLADKAGQEVNVVLTDLRTTDEVERVLTVVPQANEEGQGILGIFLGSAANLSYEGTERVFAGFLHTYNMLSYTRHVLGQLIGLSVSEGSIAPVSEGVAGPVGIYSVVGAILNYGGPQAYLGLIDFIALMSLSLAFLNIMPFPALDGGRLVFVFIEMIVGKRVKPSIEVAIHKWGIALLLGLIVLITIKDVTRFF